MTETQCRARWCPCCAPRLSAKRFARWDAAIQKLQWPLFITLTQANTASPDSLRTLRQAWARFRRRKLFRETVAGGVAAFELTNRGNGWHPHLHAVIDCRWLAIHVPSPAPTDSPAVKKEKCRLAKAELTTVWSDVIGQPTAIVDARRVSGPGVTAEILKYCVKPGDLLDTLDPIAPALDVIAASRLVSGFGSLHPLPSPEEDDRPAAPCAACGETAPLIPTDLVHYLMR